MTTEPGLAPGPVDAAPGAAAGQAADSRLPARARRRRWRRAASIVLAALVLAVAAASLLVARDARDAQAALESAAARVPALQAAVAASGDHATLTAQLDGLARDTATARERTNGPLWSLGARLPVLGPNLDAVARVAAALDDVARDVAPVLADVRTAVAATGHADGAVDVDALREIAPRVSAAHTTMDAVTTSLSTLDTTRLLARLAEPIETLRTRVLDMSGAVATADRATTLLPAMLGADGPRTYLVLALTNAELRTGGGIVGAVVELRAEAGRVEVVREIAGSDLPVFPTPVAELDPQTAQIFSDRPARFVQDLSMTPEFPTTAALAAQMWAQSQGEQVDGVLATDPVALARILAVTGPVDVPLPPSRAAALGVASLSVSADNAVQVLEHEVYTSLAFAPEEADAFFGALVTQAASHLESDANGADLLAALAASASEHRVRVWSAHPSEQAELSGTVIAGTFLSSPAAADDVGVFFDDPVVGKMSWYLDTSITLVTSQCTDRGRLDTIDVTLTSTAPPDAATLPSYVAGLWTNPVPPGTVRTVLRVAGPQGEPTPRFERDGQGFGMDTHPLAGRSMASGTITLAPGQSTTVRVTVTASPAAGRGEGARPAGSLWVWSTPTAHAGGLLTATVPRCAP
ncbi:DUF4012 domain-containing protein [Xylanimonas ulmi]|uniref:Uncharacterized protein DUF4012 n=1 Tax=Xylanimonas ulmi TaxID=228973 RepID=A0A4Q7M482_9MICO|nr:DUF4012 domain-containing protein [Xylanibacterium ulmi]RZS62171.1 uncharacterized protein DUF4012 [Xylanibacterium ulmi]